MRVRISLTAFAALLCLGSPRLLHAQNTAAPQTRAERTAYQETSLYADVMQFLEALVAKRAPIRLETMGTSAEGRAIPLAILSKPAALTPQEARRRGKIVVYIQANIHAGEVEGKEAALMLLRDLSQNDADHLLDRVVLLVAPIYNADGNERLGDGKRNRPSQDGPERIGVRPNGQGLDLNRDCMKAESPEMQAVLAKVWGEWNPDVLLDLHTTNGTRHGYRLTYAPPLNPNTYRQTLSFARETLLPAVRQEMRRRFAAETFDYGNVEVQNGVRGWFTFGEEGRYVTNYAGLRNRIGILSEAASFLPFKTRVDVTRQFVQSVLIECAKRTSQIRRILKSADSALIRWGRNPKKAPPQGVRFEIASHKTETIPLEIPLPAQVIDHRKAPTQFENLTLPVYDRFRPTRTAAYPVAYLIPATEARVITLLKRHGVVVETLTAPWSGSAQKFRISEKRVSSSLFQGHRLLRLEGAYSLATTDFPAGTFLVRTAQPLGTLLFMLLEPESLDGVASWGALTDPLAPNSDYPIHKTDTPPQRP